MKTRRRLAGLRWVGLLLVCGLCGCAVETIDGSTSTFRNSWLGPPIAAVVGLGMLAGGVGSFLSGLPRTRKRKVAKRPGEPAKVKVEHTPAELKPLVVGGGLLLLGLFVLVLVAPSIACSYIVVAPDKIVIRDALLWFSGGPREIGYADIQGIEIEETSVMSRRGPRKKEYLIISATSRQERLEMGALHRAAHPKLLEAWQAFHASGGVPAAAAAPPPSSTENSFATPSDAAGGWPFGSAPDAAGGFPSTTSSADSNLSTATTSTTTTPVPPVPPTPRPTLTLGEIRAGERLEAMYAGRWAPVDVLEVQADGRIRIHWVGYDASFDEPLEIGKLRRP